MRLTALALVGALGMAMASVTPGTPAQAAGGCGPGWHPTYRGYCVPFRGGYGWHRGWNNGWHRGWDHGYYGGGYPRQYRYWYGY